MSTGIQRPITGFRFAEVNRGDTLQRIAARELGDAARWPEIVGLNGLRPPFITDDATLSGDGVVLSGQFLKVPATQAFASSESSPEEVFGRDIRLNKGRIEVVAGDFAAVGGVDNLKQALSNAIETERGELIFHTDYGCLLRQIIGTVNGPTAAILAAQYAKSTLLADPRVERVSKSDAVVSGDSITVQVELEPIAGKSIDLSVTA